MDGDPMFSPLTPEEAAKACSPRKSTSSKTPIVPVPDDASLLQFKHPKYGEPDHAWPYHDAAGRLVGYVCRWDCIDAEGQKGKEVLPVTYCDLGNGKCAWRSKGIPSPRPLFDLPGILGRADAPVLICEGEKTRDAAATLFPEMAATTPAHGAKSPHLTDFGPCKGRVVVIAADFDEPGRTNDKGKPLHPGQDFADKVCELVRTAGAKQVLHLRPDRLGTWIWRDGEKIEREGQLPDGWDLADAIEEGWTEAAVAAVKNSSSFFTPYLDAQARDEPKIEPTPEPTPDGWPFRLTWSGVERRIEKSDKETGVIRVEWRWFCSRLEVIAETRSADGEEWGRLLRLVDRDSRVKQWAMPMSMLAGDGTAYRERLFSLGLVIAPGRAPRDALHEYIATARPDERARCVGRLGWQGKSYVRFNGTVGVRDNE